MIFCGASTQMEFQQIIDLQTQNLKRNISEEDAISQGFVTVEHSVELIAAMNSPFPHAIAKDENEVVGYALMMTKAFATKVPVLVPMFELIERLSYKGKPLVEMDCYVMGQVCIKKGYRGKGLFKGLYEQLINQTKANFDYVVTEVVTDNLRSMKAHSNVGFVTLHTYMTDGEEWAMVILDLKEH
jgi:predicted GNAT family N-acyltransferase